MLFTKTDIHNLLVFLDRVQLTGSEAITFVQLVSKLKEMCEEDESNE